MASFDLVPGMLLTLLFDPEKTYSTTRNLNLDANCLICRRGIVAHELQEDIKGLSFSIVHLISEPAFIVQLDALIC